MQTLTHYQDLIDLVGELGFLPMSEIAPGLPSLASLTPGSNWHTGDPDTDPWQWKDRASSDRHLAYGCILNGHKGFIAERCYSAFFTVYHPHEPMPVRWTEGLIDQTTWLLWNQFEKYGALSTFEVHKLIAGESRQTSRINSRLEALQASFYITGAGNTRKISRAGQEYSWPAMRYQRVEDWAPETWLSDAPGLRSKEAWEIILDAGEAAAATASVHLDRENLARVLGRVKTAA